MKQIRILFALLLVLFMVGLSLMLEEREIIFPEILALTSGAWVAESQPWRVNRVQLPLFMTAGALGGVLIVRYLPIPLLGQVLIAFALAACCLLASGCTLVPLLSACILPVLLQTSSFVYPLSVLALCLTISLGQAALETFGLRNKQPQERFHPPQKSTLKRESLHWLGLLAGVSFFGLAAIWSGWTFLIAPPLLVTYAELSHEDSTPRGRPAAVLALLIIAAWSSSFLRLGLCEHWACPLWLGAGIAVLTTFLFFHLFRLVFPPVGAVALLPFLLDAQSVWQFPFQVTIGAILLVGAALVQFRPRPTLSRTPLP